MSDMNNEDTINIEYKKETRKIQRKPEGEIAYVLLALGLILLALALVHSHNISAFIGIALTFWGSLLLYVRPTQYIRKELLETSIQEYMNNIENLLNILEFKGTPTYISPGTLPGLRNVMIVITKSDTSQIPSDEQLTTNNIIIENPPAIVIKPPGSELTKLIENEFKIIFSSITITHLLDRLEKILTEDFEIAKTFKIEYNEPSSTFQIIMSETIFDKNIEQIKQKKTSKHIGDPLISSIACMITLVTHKKIQIKNIETDEALKETTVTYEIRERE
jgi:hypothetical protein